MKSETVLQCEQCENDNGVLVASELDIKYCRKIENARGRLVCTMREKNPAPEKEDDANTDFPDDGNADDDQPQKAEDGKKTTSEKRPAQQQHTDETDDDNQDDSLPAGSYKQNCNGCELKRDGMLLACDSCMRSNGKKIYTIAYASACKYFVNSDGFLRCGKSPSA